MEFNIIIGNPPYQEVTGGGTTTKDAVPLYQNFIDRGIKFSPDYISMIIPSRWACGGKQILDKFRTSIVDSNKLHEIHHYQKGFKVFDNVCIAGGVMYFLWKRNKVGRDTKVYMDNEDTYDERDLSEFTYIDRAGKVRYMLNLDNQGVNIVRKVVNKIGLNSLRDTVLSNTPFGIGSTFRDSEICTEDKPIKVVMSIGDIYTSIDNVQKNVDIINKYKVICSYKNPDGGGERPDNLKWKVLGVPMVLNPGEVCSISYLVLGTYDNKQDAEKLSKYLKTKFVRFLIRETITGMGITFKNFIFVPLIDTLTDIDFNTSLAELDNQLYKKYDLTDEEIEYINSEIAYRDTNEEFIRDTEEIECEDIEES